MAKLNTYSIPKNYWEWIFCQYFFNFQWPLKLLFIILNIIVFSLEFTFAEFFESFHFNAMLNPSGHPVYNIIYKFDTRTVPIWRYFSHHFFDILLTFLIDLILDTFSKILNRTQVRTIARPFQYGHIFTPEPLFVRFAACFRSFHQIYALPIWFSYKCLITQCRTIPSNHFLFLRNECLFFWVHGEWIVARDKQIKSREPRSGSRSICLFRATIHSPWTQKKDTHSLYLQCFQLRSFLKLSKKSYKFKISAVTGT